VVARPIENVTSYSHLGHIINCHSDDNKDDVLQRRCDFTGQANNVFCFFKTHWIFDMHIKIKLLKSYCSSIYGSELCCAICIEFYHIKRNICALDPSAFKF